MAEVNRLPQLLQEGPDGVDARQLLRCVASLRSVIAARLTLQGELLEANLGFRSLLQAAGVAHPSELFVQPALAELATTLPATTDTTVFVGILTLGNPGALSRSLQGRVYRLEEQLLVVGEFDLDELERLTRTVLNLNEELAETQRELVRQNRALKRQEEHIQALLRTDPLTGVGNRRLLDEQLAAELQRSERSGSPLALVMADIDHFKRINDNAGHATGDQVLQRFARLLQGGSRGYDTVARFGGEEFVLLLPQTSGAAAVQRVERLGPVVRAGELPGIPHTVTVSYGVTAWRPGDRATDLLHRADLALYEAKGSGRDRTCLG